MEDMIVAVMGIYSEDFMSMADLSGIGIIFVVGNINMDVLLIV
jgi:hypothetical protein